MYVEKKTVEEKKKKQIIDYFAVEEIRAMGRAYRKSLLTSGGCARVWKV